MVKYNKLTNKIGIFDVVTLIILLLICVTTLYPFVNIIYISFSSIEDIMRNGGFMLFPKSIDLTAYRYVLKYGGLNDAFKVTAYITVVGTLINLILTSLGAYVLSNKDMPGRNFLMTIVLITMFFGGGLIPSYILVKSLKMVGTLWSLMIPGAISTWNLILMRNFFQSIPESLKEAARIDGCSELRILVRIMLPLSLPILATLALFYGVGHWNEYTNAIIYISKNKLRPLQVVIRSMYEGSRGELDGDSLAPPTEAVRCATVALATLPIICVYPFIQKYFVKGMMVGSLKG